MLRKLARQLVTVDKRVRDLETVPQLAHSSLDDQGMHVYDADGNLSVTLGKQSDGTYSARPVRGPIPPAPAGLGAEGDAGLVHASWQGVFWAGAASPRDFEAVEVLVDGNVHGAIHDPGGGSVTVPAFAGEREVSFRTLSQAGRRSDATGHVTVTVQSKASVQLDEARGRIEDAEVSLGETQVRLEGAEQTVATVQGDLDTLETVTLPELRDDLADSAEDLQGKLDSLNARVDDLVVDGGGSGNFTTYSINEPSGDGTGEGDQWFRVVNGEVLGQWRWDGAAWQAVTLTDEIIAGIDLSKLVSNGNLSEIVANKMFTDLFAANKITSQEIAAGSITTEKITFTEELSGEVANFMSTESKKLVVSEEAILNHATLIGQTVVDDINVAGKLIGTDGVFTGTVDFANINVTDEVLADRISGQHIYGTIVEGGEIKTAGAGIGQVILSDTAFHSTYSGKIGPGVMIVPEDVSETVIPPGIGPFESGVAVDGGRDVLGRSSFMRATPAGVLAYSYSAQGGRGTLRAEPGYVWQEAAKGGNQGELLATTNEAHVRTVAADGSQGDIAASSDRVRMVTRAPGREIMGLIEAKGRSALLRANDTDGSYGFVHAQSHVVGLRHMAPSGAGGSIVANVDGVSIYRADETDRAVCGVDTKNNQARFFGTDGKYVRGNVLAGTDGVIMKSGHGPGINLLDSGVTFTGTSQVGRFSGTIVKLETPPTASASSNTLIGGGGTNGVFFKVSSSRRYKKNIVDWSPDAERVLALRPRQWQHNDPDQPGNPNNLSEAWNVGFIAEEVDELGLTGLVKYEGDGKGGWRPDGLSYDRFAAAQQIVLQKHEAEIQDLRADNIELRERIALLEAQNGTP